MRPHVFPTRPKYCVALKPGLIRVRCPKCGRPHLEYFGPRNRDEVGAELELLRRELDRAFTILTGRNGANGRNGKSGRSRNAGRSTPRTPK